MTADRITLAPGKSNVQKFHNAAAQSGAMRRGPHVARLFAARRKRDALGRAEVARGEEHSPARRHQVPLRDQESVSGNAQRGVMLESAPASAFIMAQPEFLFHFLISPVR